LEETWKKYKEQNNQEARDEIFKEYSWLVKLVIKKLKVPENSILDFDDLMNIGLMGLHEAIERFDLSKNTKFESYALLRIRGNIQDELRKLDWLSRTARKKAFKISEIKERILKERGVTATDDEIKDELDISNSQYDSYLHAAEVARSNLTFTESNQIGEELNVMDQISYEDEKDQLQEIIGHERIDVIKKYIKGLNEKKRLVIALYYFEELTFKEIGKLIDVTEGRVSQIHSEVLKDLKRTINNYENA